MPLSCWKRRQESGSSSATIPTWAVDIGDNKELNYGQIHEMIHRDIVIGNDYRKERIKLLTALATGMFALTVTFHKDLFGSTLTPRGLWLIASAWGMLIISLLAGIAHFRNWEDFYLEHRASGIALWDYYRAVASSNTEDKTKALTSFNNARAKIKKLQNSYKWSNRIQIGALILGMMLLLGYVADTGSAKLTSGNQSSTEILKEDRQETATVN